MTGDLLLPTPEVLIICAYNDDANYHCYHHVGLLDDPIMLP